LFYFKCTVHPQAAPPSVPSSIKSIAFRPLLSCMRRGGKERS
jgi:hypothetical protein